ncbi:protoporphyrinogen oxidase HemJ [Ostreibacterium oceani]|uniref:Protoporphyrinogen IX oxidase n=1 Tax=Ostreibacterium oceani TaxID=2654998 RepID=A0A6N7EUR4_9GAMM|nr:protoporphyrinogen oxidase HemJ [Ostreibacterium oceani]MPV85713.1 protoporphyrinogen oxidase HemJ [Ostreibacterium oceani]
MLWIKAFHVIAVVCWFAGLFYLPRLFVYHSLAQDNLAKNPDTAAGEAAAIARFKIMERKLYHGITMPSMVITWVLGLYLLHGYAWVAYKQMGWLHAKLLLVVLLTVYHFSLGYFYKRFKSDRNTHSHVFYRWYNEIPVVFLIVIVVLVIVKPF